MNPFNPDDIKAVRVNADASCVCGHHPLRHDLRRTILTGEDAPCEECDCQAFRHKPGAPPMVTLLDDQGDELDPLPKPLPDCRCGHPAAFHWDGGHCRSHLDPCSCPYYAEPVPKTGA